MGITQAKTLGIQGLGGVGKSTLAAYFYHALDFEVKFWADVSLKPDFIVFAEKIIRALGGKVTFPIDITELINNLLRLLSQRRCLLVVDNLETLLDKERNWQDEYYQQFFSRWLQQGTNSTLFLTTQDKPQLFQGLQSWYSLGGMKIEEGITLLNKLQVKGTEAELREFVSYVDGHPLTINLVAGYLREYCDSQLNQVAELGLEQFDFAYQEATGIHRDMQDARLYWIIEQHLARLTEKQQNFLVNLSVYRLSFDREAAGCLWIGEEAKIIVIQKALQELCNRSLLVKTVNNKYQLQSVVREYIHQQDINLTTAHQQAIGYYNQHLKEQESWQVLEDIREYLEIIYHRCELKEHASANELIYHCDGFLNLRGYYSVLVELYEQLISRWQPNSKAEDRSGISVCLNNLGNAYVFLGDYQKAINYSQQSLEIRREIDDLQDISNSLNNLSNVFTLLEDYPKAIDLYQQSLEIAQEIGDLQDISNSLNNLGNVSTLLEDYPKAIDLYQQSLEIKREIVDLQGIGDSLIGLGNAYYSLEDYPEAIDLYQQSLKIKREIGNRQGISDSLNNLGNTYNSLGDYPRAINYLQKSLEIKREIGDLRGEANAWFNLGITRQNLQQKVEAKTAYENAKTLFQAMRLDKKVEDCNGAIQSLEKGCGK